MAKLLVLFRREEGMRVLFAILFSLFLFGCGQEEIKNRSQSMSGQSLDPGDFPHKICGKMISHSGGVFYSGQGLAKMTSDKEEIIQLFPTDGENGKAVSGILMGVMEERVACVYGINKVDITIEGPTFKVSYVEFADS